MRLMVFFIIQFLLIAGGRLANLLTGFMEVGRVIGREILNFVGRGICYL